jgi:hypothetical protein
LARKPARKPDDPAQYKRFLEAAREAEADEREEAADLAFKQAIKQNADTKKATALRPEAGGQS